MSIIFGTSFFFLPQANAEQANTTVTCANNAGQAQNFQIGWDNSQSFFEGKGYIPAYYCTGGYAPNGYSNYVSDTLDNSALGYYNGQVTVVPIPNPTPSPSDEPTPEPSVSPTPQPSQPPVVEPSPSPEPTVTPEPSPSPTDEPAPESSPTPQPQPETESTPSPQPLPTPTPQPEPSPEPQPSPEPATPPEPAPVPAEPPPEPAPEPVEPAPEPAPTPEPEATPAPVIPEPAPEPAPEPPVVEEETIQADDIDLATLPPDTPVELSNGVVVTAQVAIAVELLGNPAELLATVFTDPAAALAALGSVGADLPPEVREKAEKIVLSAVIAGNIATSAAASAAAGATYRRKP
jgi:hypothetical protein